MYAEGERLRACVMISKYNLTSTLNKLIGKINSCRWLFSAMVQPPLAPKNSSVHSLLISNGKMISMFTIPYEHKIEFCMSNFSQLAHDAHNKYTDTFAHNDDSGRKFSARESLKNGTEGDIDDEIHICCASVDSESSGVAMSRLYG